MNVEVANKKETKISEILEDYRIACESREASILGRKEVFMGKAKFGIFGDGKEIAQIAMAKEFRRGDFRSGYYRDQTFMFALRELTIEQYFAQLYAHTDLQADPASGGRLMNGHFATRLLDEQGLFKNLSENNNVIGDISPTAGQIPRIVGLGLASKLFRQNKELHTYSQFSNKGEEVVFGTIGNAATSEGMFFETINAIGVLQIPVVMSVWDDGYGISVTNEYQTTKASISKALAGFQRTENEKGFEIFTVKGWDYEGLCNTYKKAVDLARTEHVPVLIHVDEMTQPQGHSTSGSHERYKSKEQLQWEIDHDCIKYMRNWILTNEYATEKQLETIEKEAKSQARTSKEKAWKAYRAFVQRDQDDLERLLLKAENHSSYGNEISNIRTYLDKTMNPLKKDSIVAAKKALRVLRNENIEVKREIQNWLNKIIKKNEQEYGSHMYSESGYSALLTDYEEPRYGRDTKLVDGREVLRACFDNAFAKDPTLIAFGEDVGKIGDVNQAFAGLQEKFGEIRISDTGIREVTIIGQGIGAAMRGLKPIAEIQYLDYLVYALATLTDDLATLQYRTVGGQKAPVIIRTRGHRLEGVWHSGSPMSMILGSLRGVFVLVPRNMTQAAGMYNVLFNSDDTALMIESLNGYRLKERMPENIDTFTVPFGIPEILKQGEDVTIVTYGSMCRIVMDAAMQLSEVGISCEVIDVQTLLPFDKNKSIVDSLKKTNRIIFADEDVPGGASAYMMQKVLEEQDGYLYLDSKPLTICSKEHRPAYGSDGDYFSKPNAEDIFDAVYGLMNEANPNKYPSIY